MNYSDFSAQDPKVGVSRRTVMEAMKSIVEGKGDEALLHLSTSLSMISRDHQMMDFEFLNVIKNENLFKEIRKNSLTLNIHNTVPLFVSKEIEAIGSSEGFKKHIEKRSDLNLFTEIFMGSLQNNPKSIANTYLKLEEETKKFFSEDFNGWVQIIKNSHKTPSF